MTTTYLQKTVCDYKDHVEQIAKLRQDTAKCLEEVQSLINSDLNRRKFTITLPSLQIPEFDLSKRMPCVLFIGSQNCGKSTLLNTFLKYKKLLPALQTPCTSRLVRVVHSSPASATLVDSQMERQGVDFKDRKKYIELKGDDRGDIEKLKTIVEVGIKHDLLECGIELIDSPGRNENDALNRVVEEFIQKGIVPLIVYIVDGNSHIQQSDRTTIGELQDKFPNVTIMFVCSKVDVDMNAYRFDHESEDDISDEQLFTLAQKKKIAVFEQLKRLDFIPPDADINTYPLFHGVSANEVSASRRQNPVLKNAATMSFDNFELCIYDQLESSLRRGSKSVLTTLLSAQEMILSSIVGTQRSFAHALTSVPGENYDKALEAELSLFTMMLKLVCDKSKITNMVGHKLEELSSVFLQEGENYQFMEKNSSKQKLAEEFSREVKSAILDRSYSVLKRSFQSTFREVLFQSVAMVTQLTNGVGHPHIRRMMQRVYGYGNEFQKASDNRSSAEGRKTIGIYIELEDILKSFKDIVNSALRREISRQLNEFKLSEIGLQPSPRDQGWRRKVVLCMLLKFDCKRISEEVVRTCKEALMNKHTLFVGKVQELRALKELFLGGDIETMIENLRTDHVPRVAELAVRGHALRYVIERGPPVLQEQIGSTGHGQLYSCSSPLWYAECDDCMVKVVAKTAVGQEVWNQTMLDIMHTKDIVEKVGECRHLLSLNGWFLPEPGKLFIVMEKAEEDLLTALRRGMSWQKRADVAVDVAKGLEAIDKANYVYQDLKPQNVMITADGTAKVNLCKPEKPFEETKLGFPFHISPEMYRNYRKTTTSSHSFDIYAFGSLLWVLCEGSGSARPQAYSKCHDIEAMKSEVCVNGTRPERLPDTPDTWWDLMENCWIGTFKIMDVLNYFDVQRMK